MTEQTYPYDAGASPTPPASQPPQVTGWSPLGQQGPQADGPFRWKEPNLLVPVLSDPAICFVLVTDSRWLHETICAMGRQQGATFVRHGDVYKPKHKHVLRLRWGSAANEWLDPTGGEISPYGLFTFQWLMSPGGYIRLYISAETPGMPAKIALQAQEFPVFVHKLYRILCSNQMLVWVGEMIYGVNRDIEEWTTAPCSPTVRAPEETWSKNISDALIHGRWAPEKF